MDISETVEVKGHEKRISETPYNEIKCVLSVKESNSNEKKRSKFSYLLTPPPPLTASLTVKQGPLLLIKLVGSQLFKHSNFQQIYKKNSGHV